MDQTPKSQHVVFRPLFILTVAILPYLLLGAQGGGICSNKKQTKNLISTTRNDNLNQFPPGTPEVIGGPVTQITVPPETGGIGGDETTVGITVDTINRLEIVGLVFGPVDTNGDNVNDDYGYKGVFDQHPNSDFQLIAGDWIEFHFRFLRVSTNGSLEEIHIDPADLFGREVGEKSRIRIENMDINVSTNFQCNIRGGTLWYDDPDNRIFDQVGIDVKDFSTHYEGIAFNSFHKVTSGEKAYDWTQDGKPDCDGGTATRDGSFIISRSYLNTPWQNSCPKKLEAPAIDLFNDRIDKATSPLIFFSRDADSSAGFGCTIVFSYRPPKSQTRVEKFYNIKIVKNGLSTPPSGNTSFKKVYENSFGDIAINPVRIDTLNKRLFLGNNDPTLNILDPNVIVLGFERDHLNYMSEAESKCLDARPFQDPINPFLNSQNIRDYLTCILRLRHFPLDDKFIAQPNIISAINRVNYFNNDDTYIIEGVAPYPPDHPNNNQMREPGLAECFIKGFEFDHLKKKCKLLKDRNNIPPGIPDFRLISPNSPAPLPALCDRDPYARCVIDERNIDLNFFACQGDELENFNTFEIEDTDTLVKKYFFFNDTRFRKNDAFLKMQLGAGSGALFNVVGKCEISKRHLCRKNWQLFSELINDCAGRRELWADNFDATSGGSVTCEDLTVNPATGDPFRLKVEYSTIAPEGYNCTGDYTCQTEGSKFCMNPHGTAYPCIPFCGQVELNLNSPLFIAAPDKNVFAKGTDTFAPTPTRDHPVVYHSNGNSPIIDEGGNGAFRYKKMCGSGAQKRWGGDEEYCTDTPLDFSCICAAKRKVNPNDLSSEEICVAPDYFNPADKRKYFINYPIYFDHKNKIKDEGFKAACLLPNLDNCFVANRFYDDRRTNIDLRNLRDWEGNIDYAIPALPSLEIEFFIGAPTDIGTQNHHTNFNEENGEFGFCSTRPLNIFDDKLIPSVSPLVSSIGEKCTTLTYTPRYCCDMTKTPPFDLDDNHCTNQCSSILDCDDTKEVCGQIRRDQALRAGFLDYNLNENNRNFQNPVAGDPPGAPVLFNYLAFPNPFGNNHFNTCEKCLGGHYLASSGSCFAMEDFCETFHNKPVNGVTKECTNSNYRFTTLDGEDRTVSQAYSNPKFNFGFDMYNSYAFCRHDPKCTYSSGESYTGIEDPEHWCWNFIVDGAPTTYCHKTSCCIDREDLGGDFVKSGNTCPNKQDFYPSIQASTPFNWVCVAGSDRVQEDLFFFQDHCRKTFRTNLQIFGDCQTSPRDCKVSCEGGCWSDQADGANWQDFNFLKLLYDAPNDLKTNVQACRCSMYFDIQTYDSRIGPPRTVQLSAQLDDEALINYSDPTCFGSTCFTKPRRKSPERPGFQQTPSGDLFLFNWFNVDALRSTPKPISIGPGNIIGDLVSITEDNEETRSSYIFTTTNSQGLIENQRMPLESVKKEIVDDYLEPTADDIPDIELTPGDRSVLHFDLNSLNITHNYLIEFDNTGEICRAANYYPNANENGYCMNKAIWKNYNNLGTVNTKCNLFISDDTDKRKHCGDFINVFGYGSCTSDGSVNHVTGAIYSTKNCLIGVDGTEATTGPSPSPKKLCCAPGAPSDECYDPGGGTGCILDEECTLNANDICTEQLCCFSRGGGTSANYCVPIACEGNGSPCVEGSITSGSCNLRCQEIFGKPSLFEKCFAPRVRLLGYSTYRFHGDSPVVNNLDSTSGIELDCSSRDIPNEKTLPCDFGFNSVNSGSLGSPFSAFYILSTRSSLPRIEFNEIKISDTGVCYISQDPNAVPSLCIRDQAGDPEDLGSIDSCRFRVGLPFCETLCSETCNEGEGICDLCADRGFSGSQDCSERAFMTEPNNFEQFGF